MTSEQIKESLEQAKRFDQMSPSEKKAYVGNLYITGKIDNAERMRRIFLIDLESDTKSRVNDAL